MKDEICDAIDTIIGNNDGVLTWADGLGILYKLIGVLLAKG